LLKENGADMRGQDATPTAVSSIQWDAVSHTYWRGTGVASF